MRLRLANLRLDQYDFTGGAEALEGALGLDPRLAEARRQLGRCYNMLERYQDALDTLDALASPEYERGVALAGLGMEAGAEAEFRACLAEGAGHPSALRHLRKLLRRQGRAAELLDLCEDLVARGVSHAQLLYTWGAALALGGREEEARALLMNRDRIVELALPLPESFSDIGAFNTALSAEILANPYRLSEFPVQDEANRGSRRVHALLAGSRPELIYALIDSIQRLVAAHAPARLDGFDPWMDARPDTARLKTWGLIQSNDDYEEWHSHPGGWLSGVYYVRVPASVSDAGGGAGCIEFGPPPALDRAIPGYVPVRRYRPREGHLFLAPSHYAHRTIPTGADEHRISIAFDVVPAA